MIEIQNVDIYGWETAVRGMRNPLNSWHKSDSEWRRADQSDEWEFIVGDNDRALMMQLVRAGSDHAKFMRMITVTADITAPLYWWKEFDTYKIGTVRNSCSTMHTIHKKEFEIDDFSHEHIDNDSMPVLKMMIMELNDCRRFYNETKDKELWYQMIQLLPSSYNQRATVQMNYAVLRNMYHSRKNHKLDEWRAFCEWVETLSLSELITDQGGAGDEYTAAG